MSYRALYRKYRPKTFDEVVGQNPIIKTIKNIIKNNKISHAYLFNGPRGTGKTSVAKLVAKTVNCINQESGNCCNKCDICKYIDNNESTDVIEIDAASNNGVDEIRELKNKISLVPIKCKYKVYIVDEVHMLSIGAFNAFLKTLEEPPKHAIFILATTEMHKIPLTILSRCQIFNFHKINNEIIEERLNFIIDQEHIKIDEKAVKEISLLSDGSMRDAIGLLDQLNSYSNNKIEIDDVYQISGSISNKEISLLLECVLKNNFDELFQYVDNFYQEGKDFIRLTEKILIFLRDLLLYKNVPTYFKNKHKNVDLYIKVDKISSKEKIYKFIDEINKVLIDMKISNHPKILFEITLLKILENKKELEKNVEKENLVKKETKIQKNNENDENDENDENKYEKYKKTIINNTLALAEKKYLKQFEIKWGYISSYLIKSEFKQAATILLDSKVVAATNNRSIISYKYDNILMKAEKMLPKIEILIEQLMDRKYQIINLSETEWKKIRSHYIEIKKTKKKIDTISEENIVGFDRDKYYNRTNQSKDVKRAINEFGEDLIEMKG